MRFLPHHRVMGDIDDLAVQETAAGEVEDIGLDLCLLPRIDEADVAVGNHRLHFQMTVHRRDHHDLLRRGHRAANRMHRQLLDADLDRRAEQLPLQFLVAHDGIFTERGEQPYSRDRPKW